MRLHEAREQPRLDEVVELRFRHLVEHAADRDADGAGEALGEIVPPTSVEARQLLALGEANIRITPLELVFAYRKLALKRNLPPTVFNGLIAATEYGTARLARPGQNWVIAVSPYSVSEGEGTRTLGL